MEKAAMSNITIGSKVRCVWRGRLTDGVVTGVTNPLIAQRVDPAFGVAHSQVVQYADIKLDNGYIARFEIGSLEAIADSTEQTNETGKERTEGERIEFVDGPVRRAPVPSHWLTDKLETKPAPRKGKQHGTKTAIQEGSIGKDLKDSAS
jgi:hypothetical protein